MTESEKTILLKLISVGQISKALDRLLLMEIPTKDKSLVALIKASYKRLEKDSQKGILSVEQESIERNKINNRILELLNGDAATTESLKSRSSRRKSWEYIVSLGVIVGILGGIAEFSGCNLMSWSNEGSNLDTFSVTVFVHGKKGKDDRILKNEGQVMLSLRTNEMPSSINEKGEATFKEIPIGFKNQKALIRIEHFQPYRLTHPDNMHLLEPNADIYVEVALEGTNRIFGKVMDYGTEQWLDSVRVSIENLEIYTDEFGWFELFIPEDKQRKFQRISFYKLGYEIVELDSIPVHVQQEIQVSLKNI